MGDGECRCRVKSIAVILPSTTNGRIQSEAVVDAAWGEQGFSQLQPQRRLQDGRLDSGPPALPEFEALVEDFIAAVDAARSKP